MGTNSTTGEWMRITSGVVCSTLGAGLFLAAFAGALNAQSADRTVAALEPASQPPPATQPESLPETPQPQFYVGDPSGQQAPASQTAPQGSSSSQTPATQTDAEKTKEQKADEQVKEQEKQRVLGILPSFNISYRGDAVSLTAKQKLSLAFRSATDPVTFAVAFLVAGEHEAFHDDIGFPWGVKGYGERSGAAYLDAFDGTMIGNGILPAVLHQDPRYFRLGHGTTTHRMLYALMTNVMCKSDKSRKWEPNYSNVAGNIASGAISNLYYPPSGSGIGQTFTNGMIVTAEGGVGSLFQEFWPDLSRHFLHKDPTHGLDAQARAQDAADKAAKKQSASPQPVSPQ